MTILFFARLFYPHIGGVEKHVYEVGKRLIAQGHKLILVTEGLDSSNYQTDVLSAKMKGELAKWEIYHLPVGSSPRLKKFTIWWWLLRHKNILSKTDLVHCHDVFFWYLPFRFLFPRKPVYTTFHGYEGNSLPSYRAKIMHKLAEKLSYGNICIGAFLAKWYGTKASLISYGGINLPSVNSITRLHNDHKTIKFLFIGRLEEEVGILEYLKALVILKEKGLKFNLIVLGDGSLLQEAKSFVAKNHLKAVFKGFVQNVNSYLEKSDYILVSRYLGILEAMSYKKLVFALYNSPIKKDYLNLSPFNKFIVIEGNEEKLAEKAGYYLVNTKESELLISHAYNWVKTQTWDNLTDNYLRLWKVPI